MDIHSKTLNIFKGFIDDLIKVFPEHKITLYENYSDILGLETIVVNENIKLKDFLNKIDVISSEITERNEKIFENDLYLLKDISFKELWCSNISDKTKDNIWKYLQSFCLINININSNDKLSEALSDIENKNKVNKKVAKDLQNYKKINEDFAKSSPSEDELEGFDNILNNTSIGKIAKEITEELNIEEMADGGDVQQIFNPDNMMKIFSSINSKVTNNANLNKEDLANEATNICGSMKDNPLFSQLMGMQNMFGNMQQQMNQQGSNEETNSEVKEDQNIKKINTDPNHDPNDTKKRLKKKLDKKKANIIKLDQ
tara:strand:+ start:218 stop:1159 length:942 start_codon:yes stop_codon:yes gene_type:complete